MVDRPTEKDIKDSLNKGTDEAAKMKEQIWQRIEQQLGEQSVTPSRRRPKRKRRSLIQIGALTAAALIVLFFTTAEPGMALINQIKTWFEPEKTIRQELEGMPTDDVVTVQEGNADYVIYIDETRYKLVTADGVDRIELIEPLDERYPEVYMAIYQEADAPQTVAGQLHEQLSELPFRSEIEEVEEPVEGLRVRGIGGTGGKAWDDPVTLYYVMDNGQGGSFVFKQQYFLEASEGHGARFHYMLQEFYITDEQDMEDGAAD